jgi:hypothetical protein
MLDWILVTCLTLFHTIYLSRECMEGRSSARLDSGNVSHPKPHYIFV